MIDILVIGVAFFALAALGLVVSGFIYGKVTGYDEVETVNDAVAEAHKRRND